jgi:hypothetical protein
MDFKPQIGVGAGFVFYQFCPLLPCLMAARLRNYPPVLLTACLPRLGWTRACLHS